MITDMKEDLALLVSKTYLGDLVTSNDPDPSDFAVDVKRINSLTVLIRFRYEGEIVSFRAMLSRQGESIFFRVHEKISGNHLFKGFGGFLNGKPGIDGGIMNQLNGFYFHMAQSDINEEETHMYFLSKTHRHISQPPPEADVSQLTAA